jgi:hypothetical protein
MITDKNTYLSDAQAITGTAASTEYLNCGAAGGGEPGPYVVFRVTQVFNTLTTLTVDLQCHEDSAFSTGTRTIASLGAVPLASLTANTIIGALKIPANHEQYIRAYYTVGGSNPSTGTISAFVTYDLPVGVAITNA